MAQDLYSGGGRDSDIVRRYAELIKKDVEDIVWKHLNATIREQLNAIIATATEEATKNIARKLLEIVIRDAAKTPQQEATQTDVERRGREAL